MNSRNASRTFEPLEPRLLMAVHAVLNDNDSGAGSLRQAIADAASGDTIDLSGVTSPIHLSGQIALDKDLTISRAASQLAIFGSTGGRIFEVARGSTVALSNLHLTRGDAGVSAGGGAIYNGGALTLARVTLSSNRGARFGGALYNAGGAVTITDSHIGSNVAYDDGTANYVAGGAIYSAGGSLNVTRSTFFENIVDGGTMSGTGGRNGWGGAIFVDNSTVALTNCTFSHNVARGSHNPTGFGANGYGGGVAINGSTSTASIVHCTFADNHALGGDSSSGQAVAYGGGLMLYFCGPVTLTNNLFASNYANLTRAEADRIAGSNHPVPVTVGNYATVPGVTTVFSAADHVGTTASPLPVTLGLFRNDGNGATRLPSSEVRDLGSWTQSVPTLDQRGEPRVGLPDPGAVERQPVTVQSTDDFPTAINVGETLSYTFRATSVDGGPVSITAPLLPGWLTLTDHGDGTATLSGAAPDGDGGESFVVTFSDDVWTVEQTLSIGVKRPPAFTSDAPPPTAYFDTRYNHRIQASDANGEPLAITAEGLPDWLSLVDHGDGTATLAGMPTESLASSHAITLRVSDGEFVTENSFTVDVPMERFRLDAHGTLTVMGTIGRDSIQVWVRENQVRTVVNGQIRNFPLSAVTGVSIYALDDHDRISVNMRWIPAYVLGGGGNDTIVGGDQRDFFIGGSGHDRLNGAGGDDRLSGLGGNDYLEGGSGKDHLTGGDGHDVLVGNAGNDRLYGDAGNDILYAKDSAYDILHGGDGDDQAIFDPNDLLHETFTTPA